MTDAKNIPTTDEQTTGVAIALVQEERRRQDLKWGRRPGVWPVSQPVRLAVLTEEVGEVAREILDSGAYRPDATARDELLEEVVQVAAVATAWVEALITERPLPVRLALPPPSAQCTGERESPALRCCLRSGHDGPHVGVSDRVGFVCWPVAEAP